MSYVAIVVTVVVIAMGGSVVYSWAKYRSSQRRRQIRHRNPLELAIEPQPQPDRTLPFAVPWKIDFRHFYHSNCGRTQRISTATSSSIYSRRTAILHTRQVRSKTLEYQFAPLRQRIKQS